MANKAIRDSAITGIILARDEERSLAGALESLQFCERLIVIDNASRDRTAEIARSYGALVLPAPPAPHFDGLRNLALPHCATEWVVVIDADERVLPRLAQEFVAHAAANDPAWNAFAPPFRNQFLGAWMTCSGWYPGYLRPVMFRRGCFRWRERVHEGAEVDGEVLHLPFDDPECAIDHQSYPDLHAYGDKLNRYTTAETDKLLEAGTGHSWQGMLAHFVNEWRLFYEVGRGDRAGMRGFLLAFLSGFYWWVARAKLADRRRRQGGSLDREPVPGSVQEMLEFMIAVYEQGPEPWVSLRRESGPPTVDQPPLVDTVTYPAPPPLDADGFRNPPGSTITACVLARNEERKLPEALRSLWFADQIIVIDNQSDDATAEIARSFGALVISAPPAKNFDDLRMLAVPHAVGDWFHVQDADERILPELAVDVLRLVRESGDQFEALMIPFRNNFCGRFMEHSGWWPSYTRPQLLKLGKFTYGKRLHSGVQVDGRVVRLPPDPQRAILHYSYDSIEHYLEKINSYTDGEAENLREDGAGHSWESMIAHFVHDWQVYYDRNQGSKDGLHGYLLATLSAFYRFFSRAKLWDLRRQRGEIDEGERVPANLGEILRFMAQVSVEGAERWISLRNVPPNAHPSPIRSEGAAPESRPPTGLNDALSAPTPPPAAAHPTGMRGPSVSRREHGSGRVTISGPIFHHCGLGDDLRQLALALLRSGEPLDIAPEEWGGGNAVLPTEMQAVLQGHLVPAGTPGEMRFVQTLPGLLRPAAADEFTVVRSMFETDRLPPPFAELFNRYPRVLVPSQFNRDTFVRSGVDPHRIGILPGCIDPAPFTAPDPDPWPIPLPPVASGRRPYVFLSTFDFRLQKGWDILIEAFVREFLLQPEGGRRIPHASLRKPILLIKTWSSLGYTMADIRNQVEAFLLRKFGRGLRDFPQIVLWQEDLPIADLPRLFAAVDAFVLASHGEGWCRPLMEAMAAGLPTIATDWSGLTAFYSRRVGYPVGFRIMPVTPAAAAEIPLYAGHCWAEPDREHLQQRMRQLLESPEQGKRRGRRAQRHIEEHFSLEVVGKQFQAELEHCRHLARNTAPSQPPAAAAIPPPASSLVQQSAVSGQQSAAPASTPSPASNIQQPASRFYTWPLPPQSSPLPAVARRPLDFRVLLGRRLRVLWIGDLSILSSLALVNREVCLLLLAMADIELSLFENPQAWPVFPDRNDDRFRELFSRLGAALSGPPDVVVGHQFPPLLVRPGAGRYVLYQPWEYGHAPEDWVAAARDWVDEVWAYSRPVRAMYARSGVPAEKVHLVPLGFNPAVFTPEGPELALPTRKRVKIASVGGAIDRKGADVLLSTYLRGFRRSDDLSLVVRNVGEETYYFGATLGEEFRRAQRDPTAPEIVYLKDNLSEAALSSLYRGCDCLAAPYRGEGYGLPVVEAMGCGRLVIVTSGGPTDDFVDDDTAIRLPSYRKLRGTNEIGQLRCVGDLWQLEPDPQSLLEALCWVRDHPREARERGARAAERVHAACTWGHTAARIRERLVELMDPTRPEPFAPSRPWVGNGAA